MTKSTSFLSFTLPRVRLFLGLALLPSIVGASATPSTFFGGSNNDAYLNWYNTYGSSNFDKVTFLNVDAQDGRGVAVHWSLESSLNDGNNNVDSPDTLRVAVAARSDGWVGFGIAESGGMTGADIVTFEKATGKLKDQHVLDVRFPIEDDCNNWVLLNSWSDGGFLIFEATRLLDTGDTQDRAIVNDGSLEVANHRVIAAWGDTPSVSYHGPNRARGSIRFYTIRTASVAAASDSITEQEMFAEAMANEAEGSFVVQADNYRVPARETQYSDFCLTQTGLENAGVPIDSDLHLIGVEPIIDPAAAAYVHHFVLYAGSGGELRRDGLCNDDSLAETAYAWAPGEPPFLYPDNTGGPLGRNGYKEFMLEIHYNNPRFVRNVVDSSGVRLYYTSVKRQHDMGLMQTGDPWLGLYGSRVGSGLTQHQFICPASCSRQFGRNSPLQVVRESLHMHQAGARMTNEQIRNGQVVRQGVVDFFDFDQQGSYQVVQEPFQILRGDSFRTTCQYNSASGTRFGQSSQEEMCIAFLWYYPRQVLLGYPYLCGYDVGIGTCETSWESQSLTDLGRGFGVPATQCLLPPTPTPVTSAPITSAPVTSAPITSAPVTSAPVTPAPTDSRDASSRVGMLRSNSILPQRNP